MIYVISLLVLLSNILTPAYETEIQQQINNQPIIDVCRINNTTVNVYFLKKSIPPAFIKVQRTLNGRTAILYHELEDSGLNSYHMRDRNTISARAKYTIIIQPIGSVRGISKTVYSQRDCYMLYKPSESRSKARERFSGSLIPVSP